MNEETYRSLKEIMKFRSVLHGHGLPEKYTKQVEDWIDEVAKEYTDEEENKVKEVKCICTGCGNEHMTAPVETVSYD